MADQTWTTTEVAHGHCTVSNGEITIKVLSDFSGDMTNECSGDFFAFPDLRDFIRGGKLLEQLLTEHYGGWG